MKFFRYDPEISDFQEISSIGKKGHFCRITEKGHLVFYFSGIEYYKTKRIAANSFLNELEDEIKEDNDKLKDINKSDKESIEKLIERSRKRMLLMVALFHRVKLNKEKAEDDGNEILNKLTAKD